MKWKSECGGRAWLHGMGSWLSGLLSKTLLRFLSFTYVGCMMETLSVDVLCYVKLSWGALVALKFASFLFGFHG